MCTPLCSICCHCDASPALTVKIVRQLVALLSNMHHCRGHVTYVCNFAFREVGAQYLIYTWYHTLTNLSAVHELPYPLSFVANGLSNRKRTLFIYPHDHPECTGKVLYHVQGAGKQGIETAKSGQPQLRIFPQGITRCTVKWKVRLKVK